ncbi:MAG: leucine-rich repeat protein [Clostridia bacterium]|nr:leucine-rich repeat protein [Clostridia bacterium]
MSKKEKKIKNQVEEPVHLDIPEDEIWTYQVEGLAAPHINKPYKNYTIKKIIFALVIIVAVSISCYFSVRTVQTETFEYKDTDTGYELSKFSNTGYIKELTIDFLSEVEYDRSNDDAETNFEIVKDESKRITSVGAYALNCDGTVRIINIGAGVDYVDPKAFYSCWALQQIEVDENNPNYCDVDGVLYNKDMTEVICYPCNHDQYLREKYGYEEEPYRADATEEYVKDIQTYVVPSTVKTIGQLCFNYANLRAIYLPEGLEKIETLGVFKLHEPKDQYSNTPSLESIYTYKTENEISDTHFTSEEVFTEVYSSLPDTLQYIGSDAFSYNQTLTYLYIPESVTYIGHHAFWDTVYKEDGSLLGVTQIFIEADEDSFNKNVKTGDQWRPQYDYMLFKKSVDMVFDSERAD